MGDASTPLAETKFVEPHAKGIVLHAVRAAVVDLYGEEALAVVAARLSREAHKVLIDERISPLAWLPERFLMEWYEAVWATHAHSNDAQYCAYLDRTVDLGFGRVRRALLNLVGPIGVIERASELWRHDHTHGTLTAKPNPESKSVIGTLRDHPFCKTPFLRRTLAEIVRHCLSLSRVKQVRETHALEGQALIVHLSWD